MYILPDDINYNQNLSTTLRTFLRCLADHCGDKATCWPSQRRIAAYMGRSVRTVQRIEREAVELRLVRVERRWLRSNLYHVECLEERQLSTMATSERRIEQTDGLKNNVQEERPRKFVSPKEISVLLSDIEEVVGPETAQRNRGWFVKLIRACGWNWLQEAIAWLRCQMLEAEMMGNPVRSPSAMLTWRLRRAGASI